MKHISNFLRSKSWNVFLFLYLALPLFAQKEYKIDQVSVVNVGDGRLLFQELKTEKALNGEHRIIDGYHSAMCWHLLKMVFMMADTKNMWTIY